MTSAFERRTRECQKALQAADAAGIVLSPGPNLYYLTGFHEEPSERHLLLFVPVEGAPTFVAPAMYREQLRETPIENHRLWDDGDDPVVLLSEVGTELELTEGHVLLDDRMWATFTTDLRAALPEASFGLAGEVLADLRIRKDDDELAALRRAATLADEVSVAVRELGEEAVGLTERELAREIETLMADRGGEEPSFDSIVGSGPNGAKPHHRHGDREIGRGDPVVLDFGAYVDGYPGDQTRTVVFAGDPPAKFEEVFETVSKAQEAGVEAVEPGIKAQEIDRAAREVIEEAGYGEQFLHRTGHGVGLEVHEPPYIVEGNDRELEPGMVFSVEPGIYLEGEFGVRIEDLVVVTEEGCERLNNSLRGWQPR